MLIDGQPVYENPAIKGRIAYIPDEIYFFTQAGIRDMADFYRHVTRAFHRSALKIWARRSRLTRSVPCASSARECRSRRRSGWRCRCGRMSSSLTSLRGWAPWPSGPVGRGGAADGRGRRNGPRVVLPSPPPRGGGAGCARAPPKTPAGGRRQHPRGELQDNIVKVQLALPDGAQLPQGLEVLHSSSTGRLQQPSCAAGRRSDERWPPPRRFHGLCKPLTLEEIFIYELGRCREHEAKRHRSLTGACAEAGLTLLAAGRFISRCCCLPCRSPCRRRGTIPTGCSTRSRSTVPSSLSA